MKKIKKIKRYNIYMKKLYLILLFGILLINLISASTEVTENKINTTGIFYGNGSGLTNINGSEVGINTSELEYQSDTKIGIKNSWITTFVEALTKWDYYVSIANIVSQVGNFSAWDKSYSDLINTPTFLSNFTDDLGDRGYTHLTNFTNNLGIGNWSSDKGDYSTTAEAGDLYSTIDEPLWTGNSTLVPYLASNNEFTNNQNMTSNNVTDVTCIKFVNGAEWCSA
jgi:hypothetical protein